MMCEAPTGGQKCVLLLSYYYPPVNATACVRTGPLAKYLARLGWKVIVLTPNPSIWRDDAVDVWMKRETASDGVLLLYTDHAWRALSPGFLKCEVEGMRGIMGKVSRGVARYAGIDRAMGWIAPATQAVNATALGRVDLVLASGEPWASFNLAQRLAVRFKCPYVLDYHDLLSGNPYAAPRYPSRIVRREAELVAKSSAVTVVSDVWAEVLRSRFRTPAVHVIPNGYDPDLVDAIEPERFAHRSIVYAGSFYPPKLVITPIFAALKRCQADPVVIGHTWYFHYYGRDEQHVKAEARRFGIERRVVVHGMVDRGRAMAAAKGADACVVVTSVLPSSDPADRGVLTSKLYEILGMGTPIMLVTPEQSEAHVLSQNFCHISRYSGEDLSGMERYLTRLITQGAQRGEPATIYSWPTLAKAMDEVLSASIRQEVGNPQPAASRCCGGSTAPVATK
ncbi:MAG: glycosyltransferase [Nitrospira sp.]|nr:glycosyltransferase [Nitrospira sp.]